MIKEFRMGKIDVDGVGARRAHYIKSAPSVKHVSTRKDIHTLVHVRILFFCQCAASIFSSFKHADCSLQSPKCKPHFYFLVS